MLSSKLPAARQAQVEGQLPRERIFTQLGRADQPRLRVTPEEDGDQEHQQQSTA